MGGSPSVPEPPDPMEEARAQLLIEQERAAREAQQAQEARDREAAERAEREATRNERLDTARTGARSRAEQEFGSRGVTDLSPFESLFSNELSRRTALVGPEEAAPGMYFDDFTSSVIDQANRQEQRRFSNAFNEFAAPGFADARFSNTMDDPFIDAILSQQYGTAADAIENAFRRGTIDEAGRDYSLERLGEQRTAADTELQDIGGGILSGYRTGLRDIANEGRNLASTFEVGNIFDPNLYRTRIDERAGEYETGLEGALRGAVGGREFFDVNDILTRAGIRRGPQNPASAGGATTLMQALADRERRSNESRGLGSQGVF